MKYIPLTQGRVAIVCDCHYDLLLSYSWSFITVGYAVGRKTIDAGNLSSYMHRVVAGAKLGELVDHKDGNKLNNQCSNLRLATKGQNNRNTGLRSDNTSGFKGVTFHPQSRLWHVRVYINGTKVSGGYFKTKEEAGVARAALAQQLHGEFARST